jgi:hypothetical protein
VICHLVSGEFSHSKQGPIDQIRRYWAQSNDEIRGVASLTISPELRGHFILLKYVNRANALRA